MVVWGDVGYVPGYHANLQYIGPWTNHNEEGENAMTLLNGDKLAPSLHKETKWYVSETERYYHWRPINDFGGKERGKYFYRYYNFASDESKKFITENQNIRGYVWDAAKDSKNLELVEGVTFDNDWGINQKSTTTHWRVEDTQPSGNDTSFSQDMLEAFYGMYITEPGNQNYMVKWFNTGWGHGKGTRYIYAFATSTINVTAPTKDKKIKYGKEGEYEFVGWIPSTHEYETHSPGTLNRDMVKKIYIGSSDMQNFLSGGVDYNIIRPGETKKRSGSVRPVSFGPFYRSYTSGNPNKDGVSTNLRNGWRSGMADKGLMFQDLENGYDKTPLRWNSFFRTDLKWDEQDEIEPSSGKYSVYFYSPVFVKIYKMKINYNLGANAKWVDGYTAPTEYGTTTETNLPTKDNIYREGYVFDGWYENRYYTGSPLTKLGGSNVTQDGTKELYATGKAYEK